MNCKYFQEDKLLLLQITEEIDHHFAEEIRRKADYEITRYMPRKVIFDFNKVTFMDSAGIFQNLICENIIDWGQQIFLPMCRHRTMIRYK